MLDKSFISLEVNFACCFRIAPRLAVEIMGVTCGTEILPRDSKLCIKLSSGLLRCFVMSISTSSLAPSVVHLTQVPF